MFTDGVTEALNPEQDLYTNARLESFLDNQPRDSSCEKVSKQIYEDVLTFANGADASDDVTILVLKYLGPPTGAA